MAQVELFWISKPSGHLLRHIPATWRDPSGQSEHWVCD